jgi:ribosome-binding protein aMBF1 (putative translation factor)
MTTDLDAVIAEEMEDPEFRAEWERTRVAHQVALHVIAFRAEHHLSQRQLAEQWGIKQPVIARLEAGDHEPTLATLVRLSGLLGVDFHINVTPTGSALTAA